MYQPTVGRWLSPDPLGVLGQPEIVYSHAYVANRLRGQLRPVGPGVSGQRVGFANVNLYSYAENSATIYLDPSGEFATPNPISAAQKPAGTTCLLRVCATSIPQAPRGARHLLITFDRSIPGKGKVRWAYRCGPSGKGNTQKHCANNKFGKYGQLVCNDAQYKKGFIDWRPKGKEDCEPFKVTIVGKQANCETIHRCLQRVLQSIEKCCVNYTPVPILLGSACNSNCAVKWMLSLCFAKGVPKIFLRGKKPGFAPGFEVPPRKCVRGEFNGVKKKEGVEDDGMDESCD